MADATITDINQYRNYKSAYFERWTDDRLTKRHKLLTLIEQGHDELTTGPLADMSFPNGYNPTEDPASNRVLVAAELAHRGVLVSSA